MNRQEEKLVDAMRRLFGAPMQFEIATVKSVNEESNSCIVILANDTEVNDVRLKASIDPSIKDGMVQIPEVGSSVIVGRIGNDTGTRFVLLFSKVVKTVFYGGENGAVVIWEDKLKTELDKVKELLTSLVNAINGAPVPEPGNGANSALQVALKTAIADNLLPSFEGLTDDKLIH